MADKRISQLVERVDIANDDVLPIVASGATTTNKVTVSTLQDWMQDNLDVGVTSVGITIGSTGTDVNVTGSPVTSSGNITINIPTASATNRGLLSSADWSTFNSKQQAITLTTTGTSGAATLVSGTLNIPNYSTDLSGYVTLGTTQTITAQKTFTTSGSSDTMIISHGSGSGFALDVLKAGSGEAIRVTKTSGSGNAMTISGGNFEAPTIVKTGGTSSQFLKADGSVDSNAYTTNTGTVTSVGLSSATSGVTIGSTPITTSGTITLAIATASGSQNGLLSSTDWTTFNNKQNALTNPVTGTGVSGRVALWNGTNSINSDSDLLFNGTELNVSGIKIDGSSIPYIISNLAGNDLNIQFPVGQGLSINNNGAENIARISKNNLLLSGASTIQTSTGNLTLSTAAGNGNIVLSPNGTGSINLSGKLNGTTSIFSSAFASNETSKIGIGFDSGYGRINSWGADASTFGGLSFEVSHSNGDTYQALRINPTGDVFIPAGGYYGSIDAAFLKVGGATAYSQALTPPVAKFINSANNFVKIALGQGQTYPGFNDYYGIIALDNAVNLADNKLRFYLGYDDAANSHGNDQLVIQGDGNVGIGTDTPSAKLHVMGTATLTGALNGTSASFTSSSTSLTLTSSAGTKAVFATTRSFGVNRNFQIAVDEFAEGAFTITPSTTLGGSTYTTPIFTLAAAGAATFSSSVTATQMAVGTGTLNRVLNISGSGTDGTQVQITGTTDSAGIKLIPSSGDNWEIQANTSNQFFVYNRTDSAYRFLIDGTGNVGIGTASPNFFGYGSGITVLSLAATASDRYSAIELVGNRGIGENQNGNIDFVNNNGTATVTSRITALNGASSVLDGILTFHTRTSAGALTERMRITSGGYLKASNTGTYGSPTGLNHEFRTNQGGNYGLNVVNTHPSAPFGLQVFYTNTINDTSNRFIDCEDNTAIRFSVRSNGGLANYQANDVNLSDERTKKDIIPLESYWNKFKEIEIVKFKYKDQTHDDFNIGVIAQQVESVAPEFVDVDGWDTKPKLDEEGNEIVSEEEPLKAIYTADLHHATIKVLQEAMAKIEKLETEIDSLKNQMK